MPFGLGGSNPLTRTTVGRWMSGLISPVCKTGASASYVQIVPCPPQKSKETPMNVDDGRLIRLSKEDEVPKDFTEVPEQLSSMVNELLGEERETVVPPTHMLRGYMKKWRKHIAKMKRRRKNG